MSDPAPPGVGQMYLFDEMTPPLVDNSYRITVNTAVTIDGGAQPLPNSQRFFNIEGPRFTLASSEVAAVFPPRNGHGPFDEAIPHIALGRRTLPWERELDPASRIGTLTRKPSDPPPPNPQPPGSAHQYGPPPWLALMLFEEGEYTIHQNVQLENAIPQQIFEDLGRPQGITCDTVEASADLVASLMPSVEELMLLSHVRLVNVDDRELSAGSSNGWFAVVMANRLPRPNAKCRACLVSVEARSDLVPADPPPVALTFGHIIAIEEQPVIDRGVESARPAAAANGNRVPAPAARALTAGALQPRPRPVGNLAVDANQFFPGTVQLVLLHSWQFDCTDMGTFRDLMQGLDVAMIGTVAVPGHPPITDTGHLKLELSDRAGVAEQVWYRGPLVPFELTRDPLGPYHSADQCRRATPETGAEDVSYAAAFEVGRLLAAADGRLAQELMRWRREAFKQSNRRDVLKSVAQKIALAQALDIHEPVAPVVAASATARIVAGAGPYADTYGLTAASRAIGMNPAALQKAWNLGSVAEAAVILGADPGTLGAQVTVPPQTPRSEVTLDQVAADSASLERLAQSRDRILINTRTKLEGGK